MMDANEIEDNDFENEVMRVAGHLWPEASNGGSQIIEGLERDGIFITEDTVHLIECTISRRKDKAEKDIKKLTALVKLMQKKHAEKAVKGWFITKDEPTPDQRTVANSGYLTTAISYNKFQSKIIDVHSYRNCRENYPFGSIRDPKTGDQKYLGDYINIKLSELNNQNEEWNLSDIVSKLLKGDSIIIQGHFGVGKSMSLREVYKLLNKSFDSKETTKFPIYINLRDHHGQTQPVEAIERHARNIGFKHADHLVRAWRAGYTTLILDGFDEIAAFGWAGKTSTLKDIRYKSMELIRELIRQNPSNSGLIVSGRINYFDSLKECQNVFVISPTVPILKIGDFTHEQTLQYLKKKKISTILPEWIPNRPLLLGYLVSKGILSDLLTQDSVDSPAEGWNYLIDEICKRESSIETGISSSTIREIIEGIACLARKFQSGLGPIFQSDLEKVFKEKCGYPPDDRALVLLQRLPGLAPQDQHDGSRHFIDNHFASVAKAGEISRYISNPYETKLSTDPRQWQESLDELSIQVIGSQILELNTKLIEDSIIQAKRVEAEVLAVDILMCLNYIGKSWGREKISFKDILIPRFDLNKEADWSRVSFNEVIFKELTIDEIPDKSTSPIFNNCIIGHLVGCSNSNSIPKNLFETTVIDTYETQETTTVALLNLDLPISTKVGLTILKKLYLQAGGGRQENAFYRGLSPNELAYVAPILDLFKHEAIAIPSKKGNKNKVWQSVKSEAPRIRAIVINRAVNDPLVKKLGSLLNT